jgi:hypothetical protein
MKDDTFKAAWAGPAPVRRDIRGPRLGGKLFRGLVCAIERERAVGDVHAHEPTVSVADTGKGTLGVNLPVIPAPTRARKRS